ILFLALASFFSCHGVRRGLHSFPTRRSSDLLVQRAGLTIVLLMTLPLLELIVREHLDDYLPMAIPFLPLESLRNLVPMPFERYRSEEHTSELQSRENLVCRLLLEKKNINNYV